MRSRGRDGKARWVRALGAAVLIGLPAPSWADDRPTVSFLEERWKRGALYFNSGLYKEAAAEFEKLLTVLPGDGLSRQSLERSLEAMLLGGRTGKDIPEKRSFSGLGRPDDPAPKVPGFDRPARAEAAPSPTPPPPALPAQNPPASGPTKRELEIIYNKGVSLLNAGDAAGALAEFERLLAVRPDHQPSLVRAKKAREMLRNKSPR